MYRIQKKNIFFYLLCFNNPLLIDTGYLNFNSRYIINELGNNWINLNL